MIRIAVCDDEELSAQYIKGLLSRHNFDEILQVDCYSSGEALFLEAGNAGYDILIMDIELTESKPETIYDNGMTLSKRIKDLFPDTIVIFFTGKVGYERRLLQFESFYYLNKPVQSGELYAAVEAAMRRTKGIQRQNFYIRKKGITLSINLNQIIYMYSNKRIINMVCLKETLDFYGKMDIVEKELSGITDDFVRVGKSYLVHMKHVVQFSPSMGVMMSNGEVIPIMRNYIRDAICKLEEFNGK